jgi:hypothetical protein
MPAGRPEQGSEVKLNGRSQIAHCGSDDHVVGQCCGSSIRKLVVGSTWRAATHVMPEPNTAERAAQPNTVN